MSLVGNLKTSSEGQLAHYSLLKPFFIGILCTPLWPPDSRVSPEDGLSMFSHDFVYPVDHALM